MSDLSPVEARVAALIAAYADGAPTAVDAMAMTRLAAGRARGGPALGGLMSIGRGLGYALILLALLAAILAGALIAGGRSVPRDPEQLLGRDPVSVIAHYAKIHVGYVFVYADGRVVMNPDGGVFLPDGAIRHSLVERRLTEEGVDLVRSGAVDPSAFLADPAQLPESAWAEPEFRAYEPSSYAICYWYSNERRDATRAVGLLPARAQALLRGKERTYDNIGQLVYDQEDIGRPLEEPPVECSEVTFEHAAVLVDLLGDAGFEADSNGPEEDFLDPGSDGGYMHGPEWSPTAPETVVPDPAMAMSLAFQPILPHGTWVLFGG